MSVSAQVFYGKDCKNLNTPLGCYIKFEGEHEQRFKRDTQYFLLAGGVYARYEGEGENLILSPYSATWTSYDDSWNYDKNVTLKILSSTVFVSAHVFLEKHHPGKTRVDSSAITFENSTVTKSMNADTLMLVVGSDYSIDGAEYTNQKLRIVTATEAREIRVSSNKFCSLIYLEPV
jgi:hypothetical protein